ncbi:UPF0291 protein [Jeotgalicoccus coquinae]|uniref:UPF0291 protein HNR41_001747 n=1 Tax=Jeotgalicoccus coquinae TaxID=709509 RepID=A0A6V7R0J3_9STAP|nr:MULTISPECIES: DUF896 domain-containing protein [Jeotgalicoccus]MBB6423775.1 uncharacterized protein YnzC (UPF0291/DUF896 family) [Jeotgalicoccus coquinae]GGE22477.1 UPF0291 protein [Jeotgalicoccus coquinae]CAD2070725.1 hypothetical protein JEOCOQ751_00032 [Jeotgalicoccus coquinae]
MIAGLDRINELAKIQKTVGLTEEEKREQKVLREDYLRQIRGQVLDSFSGLTVVDPLGNDVTPEKLKEEQAKKRQDK